MSVKPIPDDPAHSANQVTGMQDIESGGERLLAALTAYEFSPSANYNDASTSAADQIQMVEAIYTQS